MFDIVHILVLNNWFIIRYISFGTTLQLPALRCSAIRCLMEIVYYSNGALLRGMTIRQ